MNRLKYSLLFAALGAIFFIPFLGGVHLFDWDEINFAEVSREMIINEDYLHITINFQPFWEKPPFFFWLQVLSMKLFGINEFAARFPNAVCGILTLVILYNIGSKLYSSTFGFIWAGVYLGSVLPFLYFKSGIIDPVFNLFIFLGIYFFILFFWKKENQPQILLLQNKWLYLMAAGIFAGLAILTKGPVAFLIICLVFIVYWIFQRFRLFVGPHHFLIFSIIAAAVTLVWFGIETLKNGPWYVTEFVRYQYRLFSTPDAGHAGFPGYHFVVLLIGCFPASVFALRGFFKMPAPSHHYQQDFSLWMKILFWVVLILFTIVKSKIVHYSSLSYFPLTFLAALVIERLVARQLTFARWMKVMLSIIGGLYIIIIIALPFLGMNVETLKPLIKDPFAVANLDAAVNWTGFEILPGVLLFLVLALSLWNLSRDYIGRGLMLLFGGMPVFVMLTLIFFIGRIEAYSQRAAIEFLESKAAEDAYIIPHGYRTYTHYFYGQLQPGQNPNRHDKEWLLHGDVDKDVYVISKVNRNSALEENPNIERISSKNGFIFYKRKVKQE